MILFLARRSLARSFRRWPRTWPVRELRRVYPVGRHEPLGWVL